MSLDTLLKKHKHIRTSTYVHKHICTQAHPRANMRTTGLGARRAVLAALVPQVVAKLRRQLTDKSSNVREVSALPAPTHGLHQLPYGSSSTILEMLVRIDLDCAPGDPGDRSWAGHRLDVAHGLDVHACMPGYSQSMPLA